MDGVSGERTCAIFNPEMDQLGSCVHIVQHKWMSNWICKVYEYEYLPNVVIYIRGEIDSPTFAQVLFRVCKYIN